MSNYNNTPQQPSSAYSRKQDEYHPLQNQTPQYPIGNSGQEGHYEPNGGAAGGAGVQVDSAGRPKKRNVITEARSGITHGAQAVRGGISNVEKGVGQVGDKLAKAPGVSQGVSFFADYRKFMDRGNVIDLAVAVVVGAAFTAIVTSLVTDIITPLIAMASGKNLEENFVILRRNPLLPDGTAIPTRLYAKEHMTVTWNWGNFVQTVINFFIISGCVFLVVKLYEVSRNTKKEVTEKKCDYCLKSIPLNAVRCPNCTTWLDWDACAKVANLERAAAVAGGNSSPFADQGSHF
ncbi:MAG: large-conductance mechanosensitive channel [Linnemannia gamsii]|nr:MAG: large-conductance mechanosensitive channel [Linnemannia gamsii]